MPGSNWARAGTGDNTCNAIKTVAHSVRSTGALTTDGLEVGMKLDIFTLQLGPV